MQEVRDEGEDEGQHSDLSPYQSDSDSAVMMSGNSPFISKVKLKRKFVDQIPPRILRLLYVRIHRAA